MAAYEIGLRIPMNILAPSVKDVESSINESISNFGIGSTARITTVLPIKMTTDRPLTDLEIELVKDETFKHFQSEFGYAAIEYFRKTG